jgi:hypothetical protein
MVIRRGRPDGSVGGSDQEAAINVVFRGLLPAVAGAPWPAAHPLLTFAQTVLPTGPMPDGTVLALDLPNPLSGVSSFLGGQIVDAVSALLRAVSQDFLNQLAAPVARYVLSTPDLLAEPTLRAFWLTSLAVLLACVGLLVALAGLAIIPGDTRLGLAAREVIATRLWGCVLTASVSLPLLALEVGLANRMVNAFIGSGFAAGHNPLWTALQQAASGDLAAGLAVLLTATVGVILLVALVLLGLARWATLWLLVVLAPLAMGFALLPGGAGVARLWWRLQLATVFLPVANAVLLGTYVAMFTSTTSGLTGALAGVAVLALMTKLPAWIAGAAVGVDGSDLSPRLRRGGRVGGRLVTTVVSAATPGGTGSGSASHGRSVPAASGHHHSSAPGSGSAGRVPREVPREVPGGRGSPRGTP